MASRSATEGGDPLVSRSGFGRFTAGVERRRTLAAAVALLALLAGCQSGIGPDPERPRATIAAFETRVGELERRVDDQRATLAALTPPPGTPTPVPFATRWHIEVVGQPEVRPSVGNR